MRLIKPSDRSPSKSVSSGSQTLANTKLKVLASLPNRLEIKAHSPAPQPPICHRLNKLLGALHAISRLGPWFLLRFDYSRETIRAP